MSAQNKLIYYSHGPLYLAALFSLILLFSRNILEPKSAGRALCAVGPHGEVELAVEWLVKAFQVVAATPVCVVSVILQK